MKARPSDDAIDARLRRFLAQDAEEAAAAALPVEEVVDRWFGALQGRRLQPQRQLIVLMAVLAMLAVAIATAVLVGSQEKERTPAEIVTWSQGVLRDPPAFAMTVRFKDGNEARYLYDGDSTLRVEVTKGTFYDGTAEGGFMLFDGQRAGRYNPIDRRWGSSEMPLDWRALVRPTWLPTGGPVAAGAPAWPSFKNCGDAWQQETLASIAGRSAYVMECGGATYWVDRETGLLLGTEDPRGTPDANVTVLSLDLAVAAPELFAFQAPADAVADDRMSFLFDTGDQAPPWTAPLGNGGTFDSHSLAGHPAAILFSSPPCCEGDPGLSLLVTLDSYVRDHPGALDAVVVAVPGQHDQVVEMASNAGVTLPIASDTDSRVWQAWGLRDSPPLVLLTADGRIAVFWSRALTADDLARMVDALRSGTPVPTPAVSPCTC